LRSASPNLRSAAVLLSTLQALRAELSGKARIQDFEILEAGAED
jgi:hypothetical protein